MLGERRTSPIFNPYLFSVARSAAMEFSLEITLDVLRRTPDVLSTLLSGLNAAWIRSNEGPQTFSPFDVVGHLIGGEKKDWIIRAESILSHGRSKTFETFDRFQHEAHVAESSLPGLLTEFEQLREANVATLRSWDLSEAELDLEGDHPAFGTVTLRQLLATWVVHDLGHLAQIARVMAKQYGEAVGPWKAYLPVLTDRPRPKT
jgi:hypothetical protein